MRNFYGCYLLRSLDPAARVKTYIGFTVNPRRRIRQHNGEITSGAWRTRRGRPWEMVLVVYGFPTQVHALQFEWAWQHPKKSKVAREVLAAIKTSHRTGLQGKVRLLMGMLNTPPWRYYPLTLQFLAQQHSELPRGCAGFPDNLDVLVSPLDTLPTSLHDDEEAEHETAAAAAAAEERSGSAGDTSDNSDAESSSGDSGADIEGDGCSGSDDEQPAAVPAAAALQHRQQEQELRMQQGEANGSSSSGGGGRRRRRRLSGSSGSSDVVLLTDSDDDGMLQSQQQDLPQPLHLRLQQQQPPKQQEAQGQELNAAEVLSATFSQTAVSQQSVPSTAAAAATSARQGKGRRAQRSAAAASDSAPARVTRCPCCSKYLDAFVLSCPACSTEYHTHCLAEAISSHQQQGLSSQPAGLQELGSNGSNVLSRRRLPAQGSCPSCGDRLVWLDVLAAMKRHGGGDGSNGAAAGSRSTKGRQRGKAAGDTAAGGEHVETTHTTGKTGRKKGSRRGKATAAAAAAGNGTSGRGKVSAGSAAAQAPGAEAAATAIRPRQRAAAATAVARSRRHVVAAAATAPMDQPSLRGLMEHLQQHYPHLQLPSDPLALQQLLLEQPQNSQGHDQLLGKQPGQQEQQQQQEPEGLAAGLASMQPGRAAAEEFGQAGAEADFMDLCSDEGDTCKQQQQEGQGCSLQAWLDEHLQPQQQQQQLQRQEEEGGPWQQQQGLLQQHDRTALPVQQLERQQEPCPPLEPFDLTLSPEPLLQRLKLASPSKGKRTRATAGGINQAAAAAVANHTVVSKTSTAAQELDAGARSDKTSSSNDGSGGSSPQRLPVRCRVNGTTPAAMVLKSRPRAPAGLKDAVHEAAGDAGVAAAAAAAAGNQGGNSWLFEGEDYTAAAASGSPIDSPAYGVAEQIDPACNPCSVPPAAAAAGAAGKAARETTVQNVCRLARNSRQEQQDVICLLDSD